MAARKKTIEAEQVLVRHVVEAKRDNISHIKPLLRAPFPTNLSATCDGSQNTSILGYPLGRCMVAARFANQRWIALFSNAASAAELFEANASSPRLEVAWLGYRPEAGWFFELRGAGKPVVEFAQAADAGSPSTCNLVGLEPNLLKSGESGEQAVARLCQHFEICRPMPAIRILDDGFQIIGAAGRPVTSGLRGYFRLDGPAIGEGDAEAAVTLADAIHGCDADGIRKAVDQGASLISPLPDSSLTPLVAALCKFGKPGWDACVELLLELGCPVDGVKTDPPIVAAPRTTCSGRRRWNCWSRMARTLTPPIAREPPRFSNASPTGGSSCAVPDAARGRSDHQGPERHIGPGLGAQTIRRGEGVPQPHKVRRAIERADGPAGREARSADVTSRTPGRKQAVQELPEACAADRIDAHGIRAEAREGLATREDELVSRLAEGAAQRGLSARRPLCTLDGTSERLYPSETRIRRDPLRFGRSTALRDRCLS